MDMIKYTKSLGSQLYRFWSGKIGELGIQLESYLIFTCHVISFESVLALQLHMCSLCICQIPNCMVQISYSPSLVPRPHPQGSGDMQQKVWQPPKNQSVTNQIRDKQHSRTMLTYITKMVFCLMSRGIYSVFGKKIYRPFHSFYLDIPIRKKVNKCVRN